MKPWWNRLIENTVAVGKVGVLVAVPAALLFGHVWTQFRITKLGYEISEQTERRAELEDEKQKLQIEATVEGQREEISQVAKERFGLEPVEPGQILTVERAPASRDDSSDDGETLAEAEHASLENAGNGRP